MVDDFAAEKCFFQLNISSECIMLNHPFSWWFWLRSFTTVLCICDTFWIQEVHMRLLLHQNMLHCHILQIVHFAQRLSQMSSNFVLKLYKGVFLQVESEVWTSTAYADMTDNMPMDVKNEPQPFKNERRGAYRQWGWCLWDEEEHHASHCNLTFSLRRGFKLMNRLS